MERACRAAGRAPGEVLLCAASKTQNSETVRAAAALDIDLFGENRVQELCEKYAAGAYSGKPLHFIGHLQTNKVRQVPPAADAPGASRPYFARMRGLFERAQAAQGGNVSMEYLSMGMSADFADAILEGANLVRVGTALFGARSYPAQ